ncbi:metallophosphoesterase family protein [Haloterrigena sp. SYSU A558-1]|uniref:Phosphoesterase n=1 Tax=Haloterrigena gelatinilytica TaxID=2741724 RepID=A0A8J8KAB9_9EURY|nr:metallophosphoesterase family protein [Haloterrigena gelatinilytica]NUB90070.1 metallophosphoesterase family protein [Haloterrigena gelatinilytica]NUC74105.1 metallophosphoesterase family protein [Haloterrigena gelatinilytica]
MKVGLISDVHSNRVALEAVLEDMPAVDELLCAGDVVGYNPWPAECVDELRERGVPTVMGNHDAAVAATTPFRFNGMAKAGVEHAKKRLDDDQLAWLESLPAERLECDGRVKLVHGHPDDPDRYTRYTYPDEFSPRLLGDEDVLVLGHTHVQGVETFAEGIVVNPGSVGQPRDGDPRAGYAVVDLDAMTVETHRLEYDIEAVQAAVAEAGLPERIGRRLARGK